MPPQDAGPRSLPRALLLALIWLMALLHVGLEANGFLLDHDHRPAPHQHGDEEAHRGHGHGHPAHPHSEPVPGSAPHDPLVARTSASDVRAGPAQSSWLVLVCSLPFLSAAFWPIARVDLSGVARFASPIWETRHASSEWHFARRNVAEALAPPVGA